MQENELIRELFKTEYRKIISVLCKLFGLVHIEIAEDITNDTFLLATETWKNKRIPENPAAWLYTVAKNKTKDFLKRDKIFADKISVEIKNTQMGVQEPDLDLSQQNINDSQLQMIFAVCNPTVPADSQIGLALRVLCGFGIEEIAEAFLTNKETINKRLFRAKEKLRAGNINIGIPEEKDIDNRLETVLTTIYLLFNEGYYSSTQSKVLRKDLCIEAMRLTYFLLENKQTNKPKVSALMSLMCFHASRFDARINEDGEHILYEKQNRDLWNEDLIARGNFYLIESTNGDEISKYHLEASIAYWHCTKLESDKKWPGILSLYNRLLQIEYSPIAALNRTFALSKTYGKEAAIPEAEKLQLTYNHLYQTLLGNLYTGLDNEKAFQHYQRAHQLAKTAQDKNVIENHMKNLLHDNPQI